MKNRMTDGLLGSTPQVSQSPTLSSNLLQATQKQLQRGKQSIEMYVQKHPVVGIGGALFIGVIVGWISKRR